MEVIFQMVSPCTQIRGFSISGSDNLAKKNLIYCHVLAMGLVIWHSGKVSVERTTVEIQMENQHPGVTPQILMSDSCHVMYPCVVSIKTVPKS